VIRKAGNQIATAGAAICARPQDEKGHLVGALVERLTFELIRKRGAAPDRERNVQLLGAVSNPIEVVVDADPFEAYECKYSPARVNQGDLDQLEAIRTAAVAGGRLAVVGVVTLDSWRHLETAVALLMVPTHMKHVCASDFLELLDGPATRRLTKSMSAAHAGL
jgi:hypothetical protein